MKFWAISQSRLLCPNEKSIADDPDGCNGDCHQAALGNRSTASNRKSDMRQGMSVLHRPFRGVSIRVGFWRAEALMSRRRFLKTVALMGAGAMAGGLSAGRRASAQQTALPSATKRPIRIVLGGYGPSSTGFSLGLKRIGDRLTARF